jgi:hypothetical protein
MPNLIFYARKPLPAQAHTVKRGGPSGTGAVENKLGPQKLTACARSPFQTHHRSEAPPGDIGTASGCLPDLFASFPSRHFPTESHIACCPAGPYSHCGQDGWYALCRGIFAALPGSGSVGIGGGVGLQLPDSRITF